MDGIKVTHLSAGFDTQSVFVDESSPSVLQYRTPKFRAVATVEVPSLLSDDIVTVGWIQTCSSLLFVNEYGSMGMTSWELPVLVSGACSMVSDSDAKHYPWYGAKHEVIEVCGPSQQPTPVTVFMHDVFHPQVTWYVPVADESGCRSRQPRLTNVCRRQQFLAYLVVHSTKSSSSSELATGGHFQPLKVVSWSVQVAISLDPTKPLGERVTFVGPAQQCEPQVLDVASAPRLTENALRPPNANSSQMLVWWPADVHQDPLAVVRPLMSTPSEVKAAQTYQHSRSQHAVRLQSLYRF